MFGQLAGLGRDVTVEYNLFGLALFCTPNFNQVIVFLDGMNDGGEGIARAAFAVAGIEGDEL